MFVGKHQGPFSEHGFTLIPAWISNHVPSEVGEEITYLFPNSNVEFISNLIPHFIMDVIIYLYWDESQTNLMKHTPGLKIYNGNSMCWFDQWDVSVTELADIWKTFFLISSQITWRVWKTTSKQPNNSHFHEDYFMVHIVFCSDVIRYN